MVVSLANVSRRLAMLERGEPTATVAVDPVEFAHAHGLEVLDGWQEDLLLSKAPRILMNITRQGGKSSMAGVLAVHKALTDAGSLVLILAPSERQAKETFAKAASLYRDDVPADSYRKLGMELKNGSRIEALPGTEKTVRGYSGVDLLILDEASRVPDELYFAVTPMLAVSGGRLLMMTTPWGKRGVFHQEWTEGVGWERYEVPATECPRIPAEFLDEARASMPDAMYRQEFLCEFTETSDEIFTHGMVAGAVDEAVTPLDLGDEW